MRIRGSSPLARGLPALLPGRRAVTGIIPARAGFTHVSSVTFPITPDHPRSRGVYLVGVRLCVLRLMDHPRSRGVYNSAERAKSTIVGSSPLARGLPQAQSRAPLVEGIIPARAGFTPTRAFLRCAQADHPRSRGVYLGMGVRAALGPGSSPLARGLPAGGFRVRGSFGIIPARAGFTENRMEWDQEHQDHPRSRGVYADMDAVFPFSHGSSPLARGLQSNLANVIYITWIIPARAGFTLYLAENHVHLGGSSPLARGLLGW